MRYYANRKMIKDKTEEKIIFQHLMKIEDWMIKEDGSLILLEKEILREQNIKIIIHSNEITSHNRPHIHAFYNDKEYQISIDDKIEELNDNEDKYCRLIIKLCFKTNIQNFRKEWNNIMSNYKFKVDNNGQYVC